MSTTTPIPDDIPIDIDGTEEPSLADVLDEVVVALRDFVHFASPLQADAVALWCAHTHALDHMDYSPRLAIQAPTRGSGKTRLLEVIRPVVRNGWLAIEPSAAVLYRSIEVTHPTVLLDEVDQLMVKRDDDKSGIVAVINTGFQRGAKVPRVIGTGTKQEVKFFDVFGPMALAGIGTKWTDTTLDRCIVITMERRTKTEAITRYRRPGIARMARLGERLAVVMAAAMADIPDDLTMHEDALPESLRDRAQDSWEGMLSIAELAGPEWRDRAIEAAIHLSSKGLDIDDDRFEVIALRDVRTVFRNEADPEFLSSATLIAAMKNFPESPWNDERKPLNAHLLAKHMRQFKIRPKQPDYGGARGYWRKDILDKWDRINDNGESDG